MEEEHSSASKTPSKKKKYIKTIHKHTAPVLRTGEAGRPQKLVDWDVLKDACLKDLDLYAAAGKCGMSHVKLLEVLKEKHGVGFLQYKAGIQAPLKEQLFDIWWRMGTEENDIEALKLLEKRLNRETGPTQEGPEQQVNIHIKLKLDDFKKELALDQYSDIELDDDQYREVDESGDDGKAL